jgi:aminopeptidase N
MKKLSLPLQHFSLMAVFAFLLIFTIAVPHTYASGPDNHISYELAISFDIDNQQLNGTAHLKIPAHRELTLFLDGVTPTGIMFKNGSTPISDLTAEHSDHIKIPQADTIQEVFLSYAKQVNDHHDNFITDQGIALLSNWFPIPSSKVLFSLKATVPNGFVALSESDFLADPTSDIAVFNFSKPTTTIHFIAAPYVVDSREVRDGLSVHTYFLPEDKHLSDGYLESARAFILRYEEMIGKFPYNHFVIAENLRPTGYGMPTFTLLGKYVIRLPFIKDTSLGHEILHCWFGNSISVDYTQGNWSEGLTSYLADWLYREDDGEGALNRKEQLLKYHSYVDKENAIPLSAFTSASHNQPMANAIRSVGYIKGAMLFHELQNLIGEHLFFQGIKSFYSNFRHKTAGWRDIQKTFEDVSGVDLERFFSERLQSDDITNLEVRDLKVTTTAGDTQLNFTIHQKSTTPFQLTLPLRIDAPNWSISVLRRITETTETVSIPLKSLPSKVTIDPNYDLMRTLELSETSPTLAYFLGPRRPFVVAEEIGSADYSPFLEYSSKRDWQLATMENLIAF